MLIAVELSGDDQPARVAIGFTENVSGHGARVCAKQAWRRNAQVKVAALPGDFSSRARVIYCQDLSNHEFAMGLEFEAPAGSWVINPPDTV